MTENKRFKAHIFDDGINERYHDGIIDNENDKNVIRNYQYISKLLNDLNDENQQLRKFIMDLQNMIQFDVDNGIKTYPKTLSEYLANALKVVMND